MDSVVLELLASRICHDLISPVGAVHNGVEFLEEMVAAAKPIGIIGPQIEIFDIISDGPTSSSGVADDASL